MSIVYKCESCGEILEDSKEVYTIGRRYWDHIDLCWDCFMMALNLQVSSPVHSLGDGKYFGWMAVKKHVLKLLKAATG